MKGVATENMTGKSLGVAFIALALCATSYAQRPYVPYKVMLQATITHNAGHATVKAASASPLYDAIQAVAPEYGWVVDYEDPHYAGTDLAIHPSPGPGVAPYTIVAGGPFQSTYLETPDLLTSRSAEEDILRKIVSDYNKSGNPGRFKILSLPDGNFDVVGVATRDNAGDIVPVKPLLDTLITVPKKPRTFYGTLQAIADALPAKVQPGLGPSFNNGPPNPAPTTVVGGSDVPARDLLMDLVDGEKGGAAVKWQLVYQPPGQRAMPGSGFWLVLTVAQRAEYDMFGQRTLVPVLKGQQ